MYLNPHLTKELEIGATIPVHQVEVRLKPQIQTETAMQNADGSPPTPSPPASPRRDSDEEEEEASNFPIQRKDGNKKDIAAKMEQMEEWIPHQINAVEQPDPSHMLSMETRRNRLDMQQEQDKDENLRRVKHWITHKITPETKYENAELQHYAKQLTRMNLSDEGILTRRFYQHDGKSYDQQLIIPEHLTHEVLTYLHNDKTAAHRGARKTIEQCRRYFYWPNFNQDISEWIQNCLIQNCPETRYESEEIRHYAKQINQLYLTNEGVLFRRFDLPDGRNCEHQLVVPEHLREELLVHLHNAKTAGHRGIRKTLEECRTSYYWPNYSNDICNYIANCLPCSQIKSTKMKNIKPPLQEITSQTSFPGDMMQIDLLGPFTASNGYTTVLTGIDVFTKYIFAAPMRRVTAKAVTDILTQIFLKHAYIPKVILTDKGSQFTSNLMKDVTTLLDIELRHATVKHSQTIGLLERAHASIKKCLKIYENEEHSDWHKFLDYAVFAHNTSYNTSTRTTPTELFHGHEPFKALEARFNVPTRTLPEFHPTQKLQDRLRILYKNQKENIIENFIHYKKYYDHSAHANPLMIHSYCLLLNPKLDSQKQAMDKMQPKWLALYRVEKKLTNENYLVREVGTRHTQIVHRMRLRAYEPKFKIKDIPIIDKNTFIPDPRFGKEYQQPGIFDKEMEKQIWHPDATDQPDTDPDQVKQPEHTMKKLVPNTWYSTSPKVRIIRLNLKKPLEEQLKPPQKYNLRPRTENEKGGTVPKRPMKKPPEEPRSSEESLQTRSSPSQTIASRIRESTKKILPTKMPNLFGTSKRRKGATNVNMAEIQHPPYSGMGEQNGREESPPEERQNSSKNTEPRRPKPFTRIHNGKPPEEIPPALRKENQIQHKHFPQEQETQVAVQNQDNGNYTKIHFHWADLPTKSGEIPENHVVLKFTTKEKFTKFSSSRSCKTEGLQKSKAEVGDVKRYYEKKQNRYVNALIIAAKGTPVCHDNLKLGLWNLHCQMEALQAPAVHLQMSYTAFRPLNEIDVLLALEQQFENTGIEVHAWYPQQ